MNSLRLSLLLLFALGVIYFCTKSSFAQSIQPGDITPTLYCLGSCPVTLSPSPIPSANPSIATLSPSLSSSPTANQISPTPSPQLSATVSVTPPLSPSPTVAPCATSQSSVSLEGNGTVSALHHHRKRHHSAGGGGLQQFMQLLLQLLQLIFKQLGMQLPIVTPCPSPTPTPSPSISPSAGVTISVSPSTSTTGNPTPTIFGQPTPTLTATPSIPTSTPTSSPTASCTTPLFTGSQQNSIWNYSTNIAVNNNVWGPSGNNWSQLLSACSPSSWNVLANFQSDGGAIQSYPDTKFTISGKTISQYNSLQTCFGESGPSPTGGEWDYAYDMWLNNFGIEIMVWNNWTDTNIYPPSTARAVTIDGVAYHEFKGGGANEWIYTRDKPVTSGCFDALSIFKDLVANPSTSGITNSSTPNAIEYGVEVASTNGAEKFQITNATLTTK